ncbi:hypothetical protein ACWWUU_05810 [Corynebacterium striatum]
MTEEERAECVGMWCDFEATPNYVITTVIIKAGNDYDAEFADEYEVFNTVLGHELVQPEQITPRHDIPRAWNPDGTPPPAGEWEYAVQYKTPDGWKYSRESWDCRWQESEAVQEVRAYRDHPDEETRIVRRMVSQPEAIEE